MQGRYHPHYNKAVTCFAQIKAMRCKLQMPFLCCSICFLATLLRLETIDCGKPIDEAEWDLVSCQDPDPPTAPLDRMMICYVVPLHGLCTSCMPLQDDVAGCFDYYAGKAEDLDARQGSPIDVGHPDFDVKVRREPLGVVAAITPWNYPLLVRW